MESYPRDPYTVYTFSEGTWTLKPAQKCLQSPENTNKQTQTIDAAQGLKHCSWIIDLNYLNYDFAHKGFVFDGGIRQPQELAQ